jgi:primase-polymerase (primpol)-like protein
MSETHYIIPASLCARPQWILWREVPASRGGKPRKLPIDPRTLRAASTTDPTTWGAYDHCVQALHVAQEEWAAEHPGLRSGLGYVFAASDPYCGIDLDHCRHPQTGVIQPWAQQLIRALPTYTEVSPSRTGVHLLGRGTVGQGRKCGPIEAYDRGRYFTVSGAVLPSPAHGLCDIQQSLTWRRVGWLASVGPRRHSVMRSCGSVGSCARNGMSATGHRRMGS